MNHNHQSKDARSIALEAAIESQQPSQAPDPQEPRACDLPASTSKASEGKHYDCFLQNDKSVDLDSAAEDLDELVEALACLCAQIDFRKSRRKRASAFSRSMEAAERFGSKPVAIDDVDPIEA